MPGEEVWPVCEHRATGERKHHLTNHPADATLEELAAAIKARWAREQVHQQLKDELGLDHYERSEASPEVRPAKAGLWGWRGLHHPALLWLIAPAFLQAMRLGVESRPRAGRDAAPDAVCPARAGRRAPPLKPTPPVVRRRVAAALLEHLGRCPTRRHGLPWHTLV